MTEEQREQPSLAMPRLFKRPSSVPLPAVGPMSAALATGVLVGLLGVGLGWLGLRGCSALRGTSSCGDAGLLLLLAIGVLMGLTGWLLLRAWQVPDPGSTSFLAVALTAVLAMLFMTGSFDDLVTVVALLVTGALTFAGSRWMTASFNEPGYRPR